MLREEVINSYFEWLCDMVCRNRFSESVSYKKLLSYLHGTEFRYRIPKDANRACDGIALRGKFSRSLGYDDLDYYLQGPCSVLEMLLALAIRCEDIMASSLMGDRTAQWFWRMVTTLGLGGMIDDQFDSQEVDSIIETFLDRKYNRDGKGGLFKISGCPHDMRKVEIWTQMLWWLDTIS